MAWKNGAVVPRAALSRGMVRVRRNAESGVLLTREGRAFSVVAPFGREVWFPRLPRTYVLGYRMPPLRSWSACSLKHFGGVQGSARISGPEVHAHFRSRGRCSFQVSAGGMRAATTRGPSTALSLAKRSSAPLWMTVLEWRRMGRRDAGVLLRALSHAGIRGPLLLRRGVGRRRRS